MTRKNPSNFQDFRRLLEQAESLEVPVQGFSMSPFLQPGDLLILTSSDQPGWGDVVLFEDHRTPQAPQLVAHRVIGRQKTYILTRGDSVKQPDPLLPSTAILAKVLGAYRRGRRLRFGFGPERWILAFFSRLGLLRPLLRLGRWLLHLFRHQTPSSRDSRHRKP